MPWPNKGKRALRHEHVCHVCEKRFPCYVPLCPGGRHACHYKACKPKRRASACHDASGSGVPEGTATPPDVSSSVLRYDLDCINRNGPAVIAQRKRELGL